MKRNILLYIFGIIILFSSCGNYKKLVQLEPTNVTKFSSDVFNGKYLNKTITKDSKYHSTGHNLWYALCDVKSIHGSDKVKASDTAIVNLRFVDNRLYAQLIENGEVLQEIVLKAKIKDDYLSVKRKYLFIPILPMLFFYYNYKLILANIENENLILKIYYNQTGALLIMASGDGGITSAEFVKIE